MKTTQRTTYLPSRAVCRAMTVHLSAISFCAVCLFSQAADRGGVDERLVGDWIGTGGDFAGEKATITRDSILLSGERLPLRQDTQGTKVVLTYDRDGRSYEESVLIMWNYMVSAWQGQVTSRIWAIPAMFSLRGPVGTDYLNDPEMIAILGSVRINPAWQAEMNKYWAQLAQIQHKGNMDRLNASAAARLSPRRVDARA